MEKLLWYKSNLLFFKMSVWKNITAKKEHTWLFDKQSLVKCNPLRYFIKKKLIKKKLAKLGFEKKNIFLCA